MQAKKVYWPIHHFHIANNAPWLPLPAPGEKCISVFKWCYIVTTTFCFQFLPSIKVIPREMQGNSYAKFQNLGVKQGLLRVMWKWRILLFSLQQTLAEMSFLFVVGSLFLFNTIELSVAGQGSTPKIKEIVLGRCYEYQLNTIGPEADNWKDCNEIWKAFHQAFAYKNPCTLAFDDYQPFFDATGMQELTKVRKTDKCLVEEGWSFSQIMYFITGECKLNKRHFSQIPDCDTMFWVRNICYLGNFRNNLISSGTFTHGF